MISNSLPTVFGVLGVLAALAAPANAADAIHIPERPPVATLGNTAEADAILGAKLLVCNTCHGDRGVPRNPQTPIIWGLQENYIQKQLQDFHSGERDSEVMTWMITFMSQAELPPTAAFFSKKNWPARSGSAPAAAGAAPAGAVPAGVAVCAACHQQNLVGGLAAPRLAGQTYDYLVESMRRYADGERNNNPIMMGIMKAVSAADREAIARYISGL